MANKRKGVNSWMVQKAFKDNGVKSRVELYNLYASRISCVYLGDENIKVEDLASWECSKGHVFQCRPNDIKQRYGCPYCNSNDIKYVLFRNNCETVDEYGHKIASENPNNIKYIGGFVGIHKKAEWECSKGHRWETVPCCIQRGQGCPYCKGNSIKHLLFREGCTTVEEYLNKIGEKTGLVYVDGHKGNRKKANWRCKKDLTHPIVAIAPHDIQQGKGCPYCNGSDMKYVLLRNNCKTLDEYGHKIALENPNDIKYIGGFVGTFIKAEWECSKGHRWEARPNNIKTGSGCPRCAKCISKKEQVLFLEIQKVYPEAINNTRQLLKNHRYELDLYVPSLKKAVEFDGDFWHSLPKAVIKDAHKDQMCTEAGITLYRVKESDWDTDKDTVIKNVLEFLET